MKINRQRIKAPSRIGSALALAVLLHACAGPVSSVPSEDPIAADAHAAQETPHGSARQEESQVVARVNGEPVSHAELRRILASPPQRQQLVQELGNEHNSGELDRLALRKLIHRRLILQEADRRNLDVTGDDLDQALLALRRRFEDLTSFGMWMEQEGLDDQSLFDTLRTNMLMARATAALVEDVRVSDEAVQQYYEDHQDELKTQDVWIQMIVVEDRATAEEIHAALAQGEDFGVLAQQRSLGRRAAQGGDVGWVNSETLWQPVRELVDRLEPGEAIGPLPRGDDEFLSVRLEDRRPGRAKTLAEARAEIEGFLLAAKQHETVQAWLAEREEKSSIEVFLEAE